MSEFTQAEARSLFEKKRREYRAAQEQQEQQAKLDDMPLADITCIRCTQVNPAVHRFCRKCGTSLWKDCPGCGRERPIDEAFCAECGHNLAAHERQLVQELQQRLADIEQMIATEHLRDARLALRAIVSAQLHPCLHELSGTAADLLAQVSARTEEADQRCAQHCARGKRLLEDQQYEAAVRELEQIPVGLRDAEVQTLLANTAETVREIARLRRLIQTASGVGFDERMAALERLLSLLPADAQVAKWAVQARNQLVQIARRKLQAHEYSAAMELLKAVPAPVVDATVSALRHEAAELEFLWSEIELAPAVSAPTLQAAQRLVKLAPDHSQAKIKLQEMMRRAQAAREQGPSGTLEWTPCPTETAFSMPVHGCLLPRKFRLLSAALKTTFAEHPGRLFVACGLALQAVQRASVTLNLSPAREGGVLGALKAPFRGRAPTTGWGLDLSTSGLKAVRIAVEADGHVAITHAVCLAHRLPLTHPDALPHKQALLRETLMQFSAHVETAPADRVAVSWPAIQSFVRFLELPAADAKKWRDMLELEKRQQIPMPLDLVAHDTFTFPRAADAAAYERLKVLLIAARRKDIDDFLALFQPTGIDIHCVQCDAIALHNFFHFDRLSDGCDAVPVAAGHGIAVLDIGVETTNIICSVPDACWFRSVRPAGDDLLSAMVQRFKLTRTVADDVLRNPAKARRMSDVHQECCSVYEKLASQTEATLAEYRRNSAPDTLRELLVVGGAGATPGLLRYLRFGR